MNAAPEIAWIREDPNVEFRSLYDKAPVGLVQCQRPGTVTALNSALEQLLGVHFVLAQPLCFGDLIHARDRVAAERLIAELFEGKRDSIQIDSRTTQAESRPVHWTAWRIAGTDGSAESVLALAEEPPGSLEAEHRLQQAARLESVGRLAGGVAHDFNNLLTGVLLYCDLLMASIDPSHRARKYAEEIRKAGMQASGLVRQLLAIARPANFQPRLLSLNEIAEGMRTLLVRLIGENIELKFHMDPNLGLVKVDSTQAQQIVLNLVLNARDAMPRGGQITVETRNCKLQALTESVLGVSAQASLPCALFAVEDNGNGMDANTKARMFEPFFTTKMDKGTGLGLATVHHIVTSNGGLIHVSSEPDRGTRVSVLLPLAPQTVFAALSAKHSHPLNEQAFSSTDEE
jgi:two-component system, cell cycle sensor histidine kinase and response regulator CckA